MKFTLLRLFFDSQQPLLFLVVPGEASLLPFVCWCVGYGGNNVGALSKSRRAEERGGRERRERGERGSERERKHSRDNGRGGVVGMRTRMGMGGR